MCSLVVREHLDPDCLAVGSVQNVFSYYSTQGVFLLQYTTCFLTVQNVFLTTVKTTVQNVFLTSVQNVFLTVQNVFSYYSTECVSYYRCWRLPL